MNRLAWGIVGLVAGIIIGLSVDRDEDGSTVVHLSKDSDLVLRKRNSKPVEKQDILSEVTFVYDLKETADADLATFIDKARYKGRLTVNQISELFSPRCVMGCRDWSAFDVDVDGWTVDDICEAKVTKGPVDKWSIVLPAPYPVYY